MRRFGEPVKSGQNYTLRPGAYAILPRAGQILCTLERLGDWEIQLPGGGIDPGEGPIQALHREVFEETGWSIARPRRLGAFRRFVFMEDYDMWAEKVCHIYLAHPVRRHSDPLEPHHTALWLSPDEALDALANSGDRHFLQTVI